MCNHGGRRVGGCVARVRGAPGGEVEWEGVGGRMGVPGARNHIQLPRCGYKIK